MKPSEILRQEFKQLTFKRVTQAPDLHLGLGDLYLTIGQQEELIAKLEAQEQLPELRTALDVPQSPKRYRCRECGHEKIIQTNHYGACYGIEPWNLCPTCPPYKRPNTWDCQEKP